jgi:hypothetical protein
MRTLKVKDWSKRNNAGRIYVVVCDVIVPFDVIKVDSLRNARLLIKIA